MKTIHDLMADVAKHLAGEPVAILYKRPEDTRLKGHAQRSANGTAVINLNPAINGDDRELIIFLHEIAHIKLHRFTPSRIETRPTLPPPATGNRAIIFKQRENEADILAKTWLDWGRKRQPGNGSIDEFEGVLRALLDYPTGKTAR